MVHQHGHPLFLLIIKRQSRFLENFTKKKNDFFKGKHKKSRYKIYFDICSITVNTLIYAFYLIIKNLTKTPKMKNFFDVYI